MKKIHKVLDSWDDVMAFMHSCEVHEDQAFIVEDPRCNGYYFVRTHCNQVVTEVTPNNARYYIGRSDGISLFFMETKKWSGQPPHTIYEIFGSDVMVMPNHDKIHSPYRQVELKILDTIDGFYFKNMDVVVSAGNYTYRVPAHGLENLVVTFEDIKEKIEKCFEININFDKKPHIQCEIDRVKLSRAKVDLEDNLMRWKTKVRKLFSLTGIKEIV